MGGVVVFLIASIVMTLISHLLNLTPEETIRFMVGVILGLVVVIAYNQRNES